MLKWLFGVFFLISSTLSHSCEITIYGNIQKFPKIYMDGNEAKGILVDMMKYVGKEINCSFNFRLMPWKRSYLNMMSGSGMIIGLSKTEERLKVLEYSDVMYIDRIVVVSRKDADFKYSGLDDFKGKRIAHSRGARYSSEFETAINEKFLISTPDSGDIKSRLSMVLLGRVDAGLFGPGTANVTRLMNEIPLLASRKDEFLIHETPFREDPNYLGFKKGAFSKSFLKLINQAIKKGRERGVFKQIEMKYLTQTPNPSS